MINPLAFYILATLIVGCALLVVSVRNLFHAGLFLIGAFLGVAGVYVSLHNFFLAAAQLLIYSGAIAVLVLFGIMMTQRFWDAEPATHNSLRIVAIPVALGLFLILALADLSLPTARFQLRPADLLQGVGTSLMQDYMLPFEIISLVLLAALIGAIAIAKEREEG